jgi:hypothetical protein
MADANEYTKSLTELDIKMRERFIAQYIIDFDPLQAALRMGYGSQAASAVGAQFMEDAYVLNRIEYEKDRLGISTEEELHRRRVVAGLYRIANDKKASHSAQVSAFSQLAKIIGLEAPVKVDNTVHGVGTGEVVFRVIDANAG